jgi:Cu-Zn family superoxide dismutase
MHLLWDCAVAGWNNGERRAVFMTWTRTNASRRLFMSFVKYVGAVSAAALLVAGLASPAIAQTAKASLKDKAGKSVGTVELLQTPAGVLLKVSVKGLPAGEHAFHIHAVGKCEPPFDSAGGHFNPGNKHHGILAGEGHAGDMPNLHVPASGALDIEVFNASITLEKGKPNSVFDTDGSAVVIHAGKDDYKSDPAGNAGERIACGVITE